jgi:hypothetical protein
MAGGRPTSDPRQHLVAVRLPERHIALLRERARREGVSISEALRRFLDAALPNVRTPTSRKPNTEEQEVFDQVFAALGLKRGRRRTSRRR